MIGTICSDKMSLNLSDSNSSVVAVVVAVAVAALIFYFLIFSHRFLFASSFLPLLFEIVCSVFSFLLVHVQHTEFVFDRVTDW